MKSVDDILRYIGLVYKSVLARPQSYFRTFEAMESELLALETLYEFIVNDSNKYPARPERYAEFLLNKGYGTLGFSYGKVDDCEPTKQPLLGPTSSEIDQMKKFADLWHEYLLDTGRNNEGEK